ncbi:MAG: glycosyltransferase [Planctomycetota bacterium]|jgi:glycosyltransferase involved in cell wall biosynthesis
MKFILVTDCPLYLGDDGKWYSPFDYATKLLIENIPEITEFVMWGRCYKIKSTKGYFAFPEKINNAKIRVSGPLQKKHSRLAWPKLMLTQFFKLRKEIKTSDVIMTRMPSFFPILAFHFRTSKSKLVMHLVGNAEETIPLMVPIFKWVLPLMTRYTKIMCKKADLCCFVSKFLCNKYRKYSKNSTVSNDCRYSENDIVKSRETSPHNPPRVMYLGRLSSEKGLSVLFKAIAKINKTMPIQLHIIGTGPLKQELLELAERLKISDIKWYDYVDCGKPLFEALSNGDTFVLPSLSEGLPSVIAEAMSQGLPVVATSVGGIPEILENGQAGLLVEPNDVDSLAWAIKNSLTQQGLREKLIRKSIELAHINCVENQMCRVYRQIRSLITSNN